MNQFDAGAFKAATREHWDRCAGGWDANSDRLRRWLRDATDAMLEMAEVKPGAKVLDIAAGAGDQTLDIAERVGIGGMVVATDLSPGVLRFAEKKVRNAGYHNVEFSVQDVECLNVADESFDAVICRLGLMLMPDPARGLSEMRRALKPGGRSCVMVFSAPDKNPAVGIVVSTALKYAGQQLPDPYQPGGLFSLGKPGLIDELYRRAGFRDVTTTRVMAPFSLSSVQDYLDFLRTSASPVLQILGRLDERQQAAAWTEIGEKLSQFNTDTGWEGPNELLLTLGRR